MNVDSEVTQLQQEIQRLQEQQRVMVDQQRTMLQTSLAISTMCQRVTDENAALRREVQDLKANWNGDHLVPYEPMVLDD
ncbi:MAG: hypothetical protein ACXABD_01430 [Candidatus Thorarchaeota archaeon]|jgi:hypothetical protein